MTTNYQPECEGNEVKKGKGLLILGIILAAIGLGGAAVLSAASSAMIVALGIHTLSTLTTAAFITGGVGVLAMGAGAFRGIRASAEEKSTVKRLEDFRKQDRQQFDEYAKDSLNPEKTRMRFEQLRRNNPSLSDLIDRCITQMDAIDGYQARHKSLLDANEAIYLEDTIEVIDNSERRMCRNFRNIINCCILVENTDKGEEALDQGIINASLADNEDELRSVETLLKYSVAYINNYNRNGVSDRRELDAWLKVMKDSMGGKHEIE